MNAPSDFTQTSSATVRPVDHPPTFKFKMLTMVLFVFLSYGLGSIPFLIAEFKTPPGQVFLGQVTYYPDYNAYFSFVRQADDGKWLFDNHMTYQPSRSILFNFEWLAVGKMMRIFHLSENVTLQVWRFFGAVSLIGGFAFLAANFSLSCKRWILALALFSLGGGFGTLVCLAVATHIAPAYWLHSLAIDMVACLHPFQTIMGNPHGAVATGVELLGFGLFLAAEKKQSLRYGVWSGLVFGASGFMRPYDLVSFGVVLSMFAVVESAVKGFSFQKTARRLMPIIIILPVLAYNIWVFKFDPVFKYWGTQNHLANSLPPIYVGYLAYGLAGLLALNRVLQVKRQPLLPEERFLLAWFVPLFVIMYMGTVIPALNGSPSIGYTLLTPLVLLGVSLKRFNVLAPNFNLNISPRLAVFITACLIVFANVGTIAYYSLKFFSGKTFQPEHRREVYADRRELEAWRWIHGHLPQSRLIMALAPSCNLLGKYTGMRVVAGNWAITPHYYELSDRLDDFFASHKLGDKEKNTLSDFKPDYIYFGPDEKQASAGDLEKNFAAGLVYQNELVSVYRLDQTHFDRKN